MNKKSHFTKSSSVSIKDLSYFSNNFSRHETFKAIKDTPDSAKKFRFNVNVTNNNIFCTLVDLSTNNIVLQLSAGKCNISSSKKLVRYASKIVLDEFLLKCKPFLNKNSVVFKFSGPVRIRRFILNSVFYHFKLFDVSQVFFDIKANKCFNGCRPPKQRRKKNKGLRLFK